MISDPSGPPPSECRVRPLAVLMAGLLGGLAPLAFKLPPWVPPLVLVLFAWRAYLETSRTALPNRWFVLSLAAFGSVAVVASSFGSAGSDAALSLLALLIGVKLLETRSVRDRVVTALLGYFLVLTDLIFRTSLATGLYAAVVVVILTAALVETADETGRRPLARNLRLGTRMLAQAAPVAGILFLLFPRLETPLWGAPRGAGANRTGLSDTMSPGSVAELALSEDVAFRATFGTGAPLARPLYWRGPVLEVTDGATWRTAPSDSSSRENSGRREAGLAHTVTLEPGPSAWLVALDAPVAAPPQGLLTSSLALRARGPVSTRTRYQVESLPPPRRTVLLPEERRQALQLPPRVSPRVRALADRCRRGASNDAQVIERVLLHFGKEAFYYTLRPGRLSGDPIDGFLFGTRRGFCEHYAASFTVLMRLAGIPARVVTGYLGGEWNPLGQYWIVRQSDAHAWSEVWLPGEGWRRVDPTTAVSPERVERGLEAGFPGPFRYFPSGGARLGRWAGLFWDAANDKWNEWVLGYGAERQRALFTRIGFEEVTWTGLTLGLAGCFGALVGAAALRVGRTRRRPQDPAQSLYYRYCRKLGRRGLPRTPREGHRTYAERVCAARPDLRAQVRGITAAYEELRYAPPPSDASAARRTLRELRRAVNRLRP